jgi:hypothetical protein
MNKTTAAAFIVACLTTLGNNVKADLITYTYQGVSSGSIGGTSFANTAFTITAQGDTSARVIIPTDFSIQNTAASITIGTLGTFTFITPTRFFVNNTSIGPNPSVGFSIATGPDIFDFGPQPVFAPWDMTTSIGPISGNNGYTLSSQNYGIIDTSGGVLAFSSEQGIPTSFKATVVPEPVPLLLFGSALIGLAGLRRTFVSGKGVGS